MLVAGTFIAELCASAVDLANGRFTVVQNKSYAGVREVEIETMLVVTGEGVPSVKGIDIGDLPIEFVREGALILTMSRRLLAKPMSVSAMDVAMGLADGLASGLYTGAGIERYLRDALGESVRSDSLNELPDEPCVTVTDLARSDERADADDPAPIAPRAARWGCSPVRAVRGVRGALYGWRRVDSPRP